MNKQAQAQLKKYKKGIFKTLGREMLLRGITNDDVLENTKSGVQAMFADVDNRLTPADLIMAQQVFSAMEGDLKAATFVRDTIGEKPTDKIQQTNREVPFQGVTSAELEERYKQLEALEKKHNELIGKGVVVDGEDDTE